MESTVKEFWNNRPCNVRHSRKEFLSQDYFNEIEAKRYYVEKHIPSFCDFQKYKNKNVLEVGCGIGTDGVMFARAGCHYHATELSNVSLDIAKKRFEVFELSGQFHNINSEDLNVFPDNHFDLVYSFGVIHHTESPEKVLDEINRVLKPNGEVKIMVYAKDSWKKMMIDNELDQYEAQSGCPIAFTYRHDDIYQLFNKFQDIDIQQRHIFPYKIPEYKENKYEMVDYFASMPTDIFESLKKEMGWHLCITCRKKPIVLNEERSEVKSFYPWPYITIHNAIEQSLINDATDSFPEFEDSYWDNGKHFVNEHTIKKEMTNKSMFPDSIQTITNYLISPEFVNYLEKATGVYDLIIDEQIYGGGLTISPVGAKLDKHIDFNFNSDIQLYRAVNVILYFNSDWKPLDGGNFQICQRKDSVISEHCGVIPMGNRMIIFASNNKTIHGFDTIKGTKSRKSLNLWYYTKDKPRYVDYKPHRTIWFTK